MIVAQAHDAMRGKAIAGPGLVAEAIEYSRDLAIRQPKRKRAYYFDRLVVRRATVLSRTILDDLECGMLPAFPVNNQFD